MDIVLAMHLRPALHSSRFVPAIVFLLALGWILVGVPDLDSYYRQGSGHCYQLSLGQQLLLGKRPYVDLFWHYGPLAAYTSAAGLAIHNSLLPETLICAAGYAVALTLIFQIARRRLGWVAALSLVAVNAVMVARFYKWYYWLFPLLTAWLLQGLFRRQVGIGQYTRLGLAAGVAALYRLDLGIGCFGLAIAGALLMQSRRLPWRDLLRGMGWITAGFFAPLVVWLAILAGLYGDVAVRDYFLSYWDGARGVAQSMSFPYPRLHLSLLRDPLHLSTGTSLAYWLLPAVAITGLAVHATPLLWRGATPARRYLACLCLGALGFFPQAMQRADLPHLIQVLPLFTLAAGFCVARLWRPWSLRPAACLVMASACLMVLATRPFWFGDLYRSPVRLADRVQGLVRLDRPSADGDAVRTVQFITEQTTPSESILQLGITCQIPFLAQRRCAGLFTCYAPGLLTTDFWQERNLAALLADRPTLVVIPREILDHREENAPQNYLPKLWAMLEQEYPHDALVTESFVIRCGPELHARLSAGPLRR